MNPEYGSTVKVFAMIVEMITNLRVANYFNWWQPRLYRRPTLHGNARNRQPQPDRGNAPSSRRSRSGGAGGLNVDRLLRADRLDRRGTVATLALADRRVRRHVASARPAQVEEVVRRPQILAERCLVGAVERKVLEIRIDFRHERVLARDACELLHVIKVAFAVREMIAGVIGLALAGVQVKVRGKVAGQAPIDRILRDGERPDDSIIRAHALPGTLVDRAGQTRACA
jgi:hypothetical protein